MSVVSLFSSSYCSAGHVAREVETSTGYARIEDGQIVADASAISGIAPEKISRAFAARTSVFNTFTHEKECSVAYLKLAAARRVAQDNLILSGFCSQLIPNHVSHCLRVALIGDAAYRLTRAMEAGGFSKKEAHKKLRKDDEDCAAWVDFLHRSHVACWDPDHYDLFIPIHTTSVEQASAWIEENLLKTVVQTTDASRAALADVQLAAEVEVALALEGHHVDVDASQGTVVLSLYKQVLLRGRLEEEIADIAAKVQGVKSVSVASSHDYHQANIYRKHDFSIPSRVLLVDDERELVQTLSERLQMREMGSAVAYDGASALKLVDSDDPEVMIIDLKMPGIDGLEVLRRVKATRPEIEVIILTGKGTNADEAQCRALGAFGFLEKPVDIDELSRMLKQAHAKIQSAKKG